MVEEFNRLVTLFKLIDEFPMPLTPAVRGRPLVYPPALILKFAVMMVMRRLHTTHLLLTTLREPTQEMRTLRELLSINGRLPSRRTLDYRLDQLSNEFPALIGELGTFLAHKLDLTQQPGRAAAIDSTVMRAHGGVWHKPDREHGIVPHTSIDVEAHWTKSGWHGWGYGWKLHGVTTVGKVWLPLVAEVTAANVADNKAAHPLIPRLTADITVLLGDKAYQDADLRDWCAQHDCTLIAPRRGAYPHTDGGVPCRRVFHQLRSHAIENWNGQFKSIFELDTAVPTQGRCATRRYVLGAVFCYQLAVWYHFNHGLPLRSGIKSFLKSA